MKKPARHLGKGSKEQVLPNRAALNHLTTGDPSQRTINNYAKKTPSMFGASMASLNKRSGR